MRKDLCDIQYIGISEFRKRVAKFRIYAWDRPSNRGGNAVGLSPCSNRLHRTWMSLTCSVDPWRADPGVITTRSEDLIQHLFLFLPEVHLPLVTPATHRTCYRQLNPLTSAWTCSHTETKRTLKSTTVWVDTTCNMVEIYRRFGGIYYIHLQCRRTSQASKHQTACCLIGYLLSAHFDIKYWGGKLLRNVGKFLSDEACY